jgi:hypothetical protein
LRLATRPVARAQLGCLGFLAAVLVGSHPVLAADEVSSAVLVCAALGVDSERLACYDRLADRLHADKNHSPPPVPPAPAKEVFGLRAPEKPTARKPVERSELESVSATVTSLHEHPHGGVTMELDNGQSWQQLGNTDLQLDVGDTVKISRAALGSFSITSPHKRVAKVTRVR